MGMLKHWEEDEKNSVQITETHILDPAAEEHPAWQSEGDILKMFHEEMEEKKETSFNGRLHKVFLKKKYQNSAISSENGLFELIFLLLFHTQLKNSFYSRFVVEKP